VKTAKEIITRAFSQYRPALAYSGGGDSTVLLDIVYSMGHRPPLVYTDSQMEYNDSLPFVQSVAEKYGLTLHVAKASITPPECWARHGFPMLGKMAARIWMQNHRQENDFGFKLDVSTCCRKMKIKPARDILGKIGCNATLTGQRGGEDDRLRGLRAIKDGAICYIKSDAMTQINPLLGWTDLMISRYTTTHNLPVNPKKAEGAKTIGCMYCGGGAQFDNSGFRVLRKTSPDAWRRMIVDYGFAPIILSIKYDRPLAEVEEAIKQLGGVEKMADMMPHVFDFLRKTPLRGYDR
jgi:3'-phosphoadenosine 5'-phosphosulfate sulfotransferase (PAPS reductase)/FAD synthetase